MKKLLSIGEAAKALGVTTTTMRNWDKSGRLTKQNINNRGYNKNLRLDGTVDVSIDMSKFEADAA